MDYRNGYISKKGKGHARLVYSGSIPSGAFGRARCRGVIYAGVGRTDRLWVATLSLCTRFISPGMLLDSMSGQVPQILSAHNRFKDAHSSGLRSSVGDKVTVAEMTEVEVCRQSVHSSIVFQSAATFTIPKHTQYIFIMAPSRPWSEIEDVSHRR